MDNRQLRDNGKTKTARYLRTQSVSSIGHEGMHPESGEAVQKADVHLLSGPSRPLRTAQSAFN